MSKALTVDIWTRRFDLCTTGVCVLLFWAHIHGNWVANVRANVPVCKISLCLYFVIREMRWFTFYLTLFKGVRVSVLACEIHGKAHVGLQKQRRM